MNNFWQNLLLIGLSGVASYAATKNTNSNTSWVPYRNEMISNAAQAAISTAIQQIQVSVAPQPQPTTEKTAQ